MNYYEHHIGDYDQATAHLTACEDGIYSRMIRWYMASELPLPSDVKAIERRVRARARDERAAVATLLGEFFELRDDGYHQHRCDDEIARFRDKQAKAKRSADARWNAVQTGCEGNANASPKHMRTHDPSIEKPDATDMRTHPPSMENAMQHGCEGNAPRARPQTPDTRHHTQIQDSSNASHCSSPAASPPGDTTAPADGDFCLENEAQSKPDAIPQCPHDRLLALYAEHLPQLVQPRVWDGARADAMRARWRQCAKPSAFGKGYATVEDGIAFWTRFFRYVATCPALANGIPRGNGSSWEPDLPWLLKAENFAKVIEGKYAQ